jgi:hypothetical protein
MEITLKKPEVETLRVNIGDTSVEIPLGSSLTLEDYADLNTFEGTVRFYNRYIPKNIAKTLTFAEYNQITQAWTEATKKASNLSVGE